MLRSLNIRKRRKLEVPKFVYLIYKVKFNSSKKWNRKFRSKNWHNSSNSYSSKINRRQNNSSSSLRNSN